MQFALQNFQVLHSLFPFLNGNAVVFIRCQVGAFFNKWTRDFADVQEPNGSKLPLLYQQHFPNIYAGHVPNTAPTVSGGGGPAWSGFVVANPWQTCVVSLCKLSRQAPLNTLS